MPIKFEVVKADLNFEAAYTQPEFGIFRDSSNLLHHLFKRLEPHGLRLTDVRLEHGSTNVTDHYIQCSLFNYVMTVRVRVERIEIICTELPGNYAEKYWAAIRAVLTAVTDFDSNLSFRTFAMAVGLHGKPEGKTVHEYLAPLTPRVPQNLGPFTGSGAVFYFGPEGERLLSSVTADMSILLQDSLYLRIQGFWDAKKVTPDSFYSVADAFARKALSSLELELPV